MPLHSSEYATTRAAMDSGHRTVLILQLRFYSVHVVRRGMLLQLLIPVWLCIVFAIQFTCRHLLTCTYYSTV